MPEGAGPARQREISIWSRTPRTRPFTPRASRLGAHINQPTCAGCHKIMDPVGLAMENFDSAGGFRTTENDTPIDTSGERSTA